MTHAEALQTLASERYLLGEMKEPEREAFEDHYFSCAACAEDVRLGAVLRDGTAAGYAAAADVRAFPRDGRAVRPASGSAWLRSPALPWALAASLAVAVGYQLFMAVPGLGDGLSPQVLSPVTLRPASRGAEPVVRLDGGAAVALAVDLGATGDNRALAYEVTGPDGRLLASGQAAAPPSGAPLLLLLPSASLQPGERYALSVRTAAGAPAEDYRFTVSGR
jgi:anti-sigma factor RsiW